MNVESIRIIENNLNLEKVIRAITALDNIISNKINGWFKISSDSGYVDLLSVLFVHILSGKKKKKLNEYVFDTFQCFVKNKRKINIDIHNLTYYVKDEGLLNLIFDEDLMNEEILTNLIRPQIFKIFDNVQQITISSYYYGFSLFGFLSLIKNTKINKATIYGYWINDLWVFCEKEVVEKFSATNFKLEFKKRAYGDDKLTINRL